MKHSISNIALSPFDHTDDFGHLADMGLTGLEIAPSRVWRDTWKALRRSDDLYIIGFSLPPEDLHVRFVVRTALRVNEANRETTFKITVVNPDRGVFLRFARIVKTPIEYFEAGFGGFG